MFIKHRKNRLQITVFDCLKAPPYFLNVIDAASPSLRVSIKQQCFCLVNTRLVFVFYKRNVNLYNNYSYLKSMISF